MESGKLLAIALPVKEWEEVITAIQYAADGKRRWAEDMPYYGQSGTIYLEEAERLGQLKDKLQECLHE